MVRGVEPSKGYGGFNRFYELTGLQARKFVEAIEKNPPPGGGGLGRGIFEIVKKPTFV